MSFGSYRSAAAGILSAILVFSTPVPAVAEEVATEPDTTTSPAIATIAKSPAVTYTYDDGMFGLFESVDATKALDALNNAQYSSFTHRGDPKDATALSNVRDTFQMLRKCNELRKQNGVAELKVTDQLMAIAESDVNWSDANINHARQFNVGENLAWGYANPFEGWYTMEKALYESTGDESLAGHYLNIINGDYKTTGFAICTRGTIYGSTCGQVFSFGPESGEATYTVDEYEQRFLTYCATVRMPMLRTYNPWSGEHHYTYSTSERDKLVGIGWSDEGTGWTAPAFSNAPVYRLYNPWSGDHHYTTSKSEYDELGEAGWKQEGVGWYSDEGKGMALYRLYNPYVTIGTHHYTTSAAERDAMIHAGWVDEGIGWYGLK